MLAARLSDAAFFWENDLREAKGGQNVVVGVAAEALADRAGFADRCAGSEARGKLRGLGIACFLETARGAPGEWAAVRFTDDGSVDLAVGTQSNGQGHETSFAQVAADRLGLPIERFRLVQADTAAVARGNGHGGARSLHMGGTALVLAMDKALDRARRLAAQLLQAASHDLSFAAGRFTAATSKRRSRPGDCGRVRRSGTKRARSRRSSAMRAAHSPSRPLNSSTGSPAPRRSTPPR